MVVANIAQGGTLDAYSTSILSFGRKLCGVAPDLQTIRNKMRGESLYHPLI